jgi:hypothetical protein
MKGGNGGDGGSGGLGGAVYNIGTLNFTTSSITDNSVKTGGSGGRGGIATHGTSGNNGSNGSNGSGGAAYNGGVTNINFNRIIENNGIGCTIFNDAGTVDATHNWWGYNSDPSGEISGSGVTYNPWIVLTIYPNPSTIDYKNNSAIKVDLLHDSNGLYLENLHVPDGINVEFNSTSGVVNPNTNTTTDGASSTSFTGLSPGISSISAKVDSQTVSTNVKINLIQTSIVINPASGYKKGNINLTTKLIDLQSEPINNGTVQFTINNIIVGTATTDENGIAYLPYNITQNIGVYPIYVEYIGDTTYDGSINSNFLTVVKTPTNIVVDHVNGYNDKYVNLKTTLTDIFGNLLTGQTLVFNVQNKKFSAVTNNNGVALIKYLPNGVGNYNVVVNFNGTSYYNYSQGKGLLTLNPAAYLYLKITTSNKSPKIGEIFTLTYLLENKGPNIAKNVTVMIPIPIGFEITNIVGSDNLKNGIGSITIMWTLNSASIGDVYYHIKGKITHSGQYLFDSKIISLTYNLNTRALTPITINTATAIIFDHSTNPPTVQTYSNSKTSSKATTNTIPMQKTGLPIAGLIISILMIMGGTLILKK